SGLVVMKNIWDNGFREVTTSNRPINSAADFRDLKIRVPVSPLWTSMFKALKAAPTSINFNEVYSALQTKVVDAQENPLAIIQTAKLYEVQKYCSLTNHMWDGFWFLGNHDAWNRLPKDIQTIVAKNVDEAGLKERTDVAGLNDELQKKLTGEHMIFNTPNTAPIRDELRQAGFYSEWKKKFGDAAWATLEKSVGTLA
ncbi:MAG: TRAP transporter substrate-binding protein, partial [Paralcaligenes sp.]